MSNKLLIFDFDETIYKKDSLVQFCLFIYKKYPHRSFYLLFQIAFTLFHFCKLINTKKYKELFMGFLYNFSYADVEQLAKEFWQKEYPKNFNLDLLNIQREGLRRICISASPELYLKPVVDQLGLELIGTRLKYDKGIYKIDGENCKGEEKLKRLNQYLKNHKFEIESTYSDSWSDMPLFQISTKAFLIKNNKPILLRFSDKDGIMRI